MFAGNIGDAMQFGDRFTHMGRCMDEYGMNRAMENRAVLGHRVLLKYTGQPDPTG